MLSPRSGATFYSLVTNASLPMQTPRSPQERAPRSTSQPRATASDRLTPKATAGRKYPPHMIKWELSKLPRNRLKKPVWSEDKSMRKNGPAVPAHRLPPVQVGRNFTQGEH